jgi:hypothetical protein
MVVPRGDVRRRRPSKRVVAAVASILSTVVPRPAAAYHEGDERLVDRTGHTLRSREARVGVLQIDLGLLGWLMIGTDTAPWAASFLVRVPVANAHVKVRLLKTSRVAVSAVAAGYRAAGIDVGVNARLRLTDGTALVLPASLVASTDISRALSIHAGATYTTIRATAELATATASGRASLSANVLLLHAAAELRVTRVVAVVLSGHAQPYATPASLQTTMTMADQASLAFSGTLVTADARGVAGGAALALSGKHVNARIGATYGRTFLPGVEVMIPLVTLMPDADLYVRF